ncbi:hypothetical protein [Arthrobacter sp. KNU40]|uniref:hypothetical protein n=1 Tax=Arthrobacter sp. KNU40 TaxID=3447965 RepID=UPI003F5EA7AF
MSSQKSTSSSTDIGSVAFPVAITFVALKLTNIIDWSWWWVLSPLWIGAGLAILVFLITLLVIIVADHKS